MTTPKLPNPDGIQDAEYKDITGEFDDITDLQNDLDSQLDSIFQEFGGDENDTEYKILVKRVLPERGEYEHCFSCLPSELPINDKIKNQYGPGIYMIWIYKNKKIFRRRKIIIAKGIEEKKELIPVTENKDSMYPILLQMQQQQSEKTERMLLAFLEKSSPPPQPQHNPIEMMTAMLTAVTQLQNLTDKSNGVDDLLKTVQLVRELDGGTDNDPSLLGLFGKAMPALINAGQATVQPEIQPEIPPQSAQPQPEENINVQNEEEEKLNLFKFQLASLVRIASDGGDPEVYADVILDRFSEDQLKQFLEIPDIMEYLISINTDVANYKGWFEKLIEAVKVEVDADQEELKDDDIGQVKVEENEISSTSKTEKATDQ